LQVSRRGLGSACANLLAFCVWLGWMYLMAIINDAVFAIFLGSSMIMGYLHPSWNASKI
jgi:hypothetical protein